MNRGATHMVKNGNRILVGVFLGLELILFGYVLMYGSHGVQALSTIERENKGILEKIEVIEGKIAHLQQAIQEWDHYSFYKEKIAREELHMARKDDIIYYYSKKD